MSDDHIRDGPRYVRGERLCVSFPTSLESLLEGGCEFLTAAFRASGALARDNRVRKVTSASEFFGGGMGDKLLLHLQYERPEPHLHEDLFVKLPRKFGDPLRDLFAPLMEPEIRFALLSREDGFPIAVPKCYFADYHPATHSGILITERIPYGHNGIEPCHPKCRDFEVRNPQAHYLALARSLARLAAHHKSGRFGDRIESQFPFDPTDHSVGAKIPYDAAQLRDKLATLRHFVASHGRLFPADLTSDRFLDSFVLHAPRVLELQAGIRAILNSNPRFIALCHWNANLDNAWFWTGHDGELTAGLLDWGAVGQMNLAQSLFGLTCAAETSFLNQHRTEILSSFVDEYRARGGPEIDLSSLLYHYGLAVALLGIAWILDAPTLISSAIPIDHDPVSRFDPILQNNFIARAQLQILTVFLNEWKWLGVGELLEQLASGAPRH